MGTTPQELRRREDDIVTSDVTSLNTLVLGEDQTTIERIDTLAGDDDRADPEHAMAREEAKVRFRAAFDRLPRRQREIAVLLYVKNLSLREVGDIFGLSESRVCQIHGHLKKTLRAVLDSDAVLFQEVA
jgi:RNA polymerase sigma factor for flagellar operon FliA